MAQSAPAERLEKRVHRLRLLARQGAVELRDWFEENGRYFLGSMCLHALALVLLGLISIVLPGYLRRPHDEVSFDSAKVDDTPAPELARFDVGPPQLEPSSLDPEAMTALQPAGQTAQYNDDSEKFEEAGGGRLTEAKGPMLGGLGFNMPGPGPGGRGGVGVGRGEGDSFGSGGAGEGFGGRGSGHREALAGAFGGTKAGDRAVFAALNWLARHQAPAGNWSLQHTPYCTGRKCSGAGFVHADAAATGLALLPFLAAGYTHKSKSEYKQSGTSRRLPRASPG